MSERSRSERLSGALMRASPASPWRARHRHDTMVLEVTGHRSAKRYRAAVSYVEDAGHLLVFVGEVEAKLWWRNLRGGAPARVLRRGRCRPGQAGVAGEADPRALARALARFAAAWPGFVDLGLPPGEGCTSAGFPSMTPAGAPACRPPAVASPLKRPSSVPRRWCCGAAIGARGTSIAD
ncbi:MAG: nitroreductase/quinone reductase family protein [Actinomycetota bacterium]